MSDLMAQEQGGDGGCPKCGGALCNVRAGLSLVVKCDACGWEVVTTNRDHPAFDPNGYTVFLSYPVTDRKAAIVRLAAALGLGLEYARRIVDKAEPIARDVGSQEVQHLHNLLSARGLAVSVPDYPWDLNNPDAPRRRITTPG